MKTSKMTLTKLVFMALCCDLGLFSKKLIAPMTNVITDFLHIPGGIATSFSLMFVVVGASLCEVFGTATLMSVVQAFLALALGKTGSMGLLAPIGYIVPGCFIDLCFFILSKFKLHELEQFVITNALAGISAAFTANLLVFHLRGVSLCLYLALAFTSGAIMGTLGHVIVKRVKKVIMP